MPHEQSLTRSISNEASWQQRYFTLKAHNDDVISALKQELDAVKLELSHTRNGSVGGIVGSNENARYGDSQAAAGYQNGNGTKGGRSEAQSDGPFSRNYSLDGQSTEQHEQARNSASNNNRPSHAGFSNYLSSIPETSMGGQVDGGSESTLRPPGLTSPARNDDDPPSPPTSANGFSPTNRKTLAGFTPPSLSQPSRPNVFSIDKFMRGSARDVHNQIGPDEDPALSEPHILQSADDFTALDRKLQRVASDPDMNPPAASSSPANLQADANLDAGEDEDEADPDDPLAGIKLKRKPSLNCGAPLGHGPPR